MIYVQLKEVIKTINFIENNIKEDISHNDIVKHSFYSDFYLIRLFQKLTGCTFLKYLRKRRLALAAEELCRKDKRIIDLAYDYFFSYEQTFIRAFSKEYGLTPGCFRKKKKNITIFPRLSYAHLLGRFQNKKFYSSKIQINHGLTVIGIKRKINSHDDCINQVCRYTIDDFIKNWMHKIPDYDHSSLCGLEERIPGDSDNFYTVPCVAVPEDTVAPAGMEKITVPFHLSLSNYCYFPKKESRISNTEYDNLYDYIYQDCLSAMSYRSVKPFDYHISRYHDQTAASTAFLLNIPIIEKNTAV